ncbi:PPE family protein [Mycobacterium haemophilum]|uniref:PPE family protein n=1 Tax=Mycobacterium haemophilum TaxID=29311 RepID=UPI0006D3D519|nr:PPE family protein [Mycobacterium haemophilum]MCV7340922.1 PPE family protein [Mycobacterium haemophilum DSM 44634]
MAAAAGDHQRGPGELEDRRGPSRQEENEEMYFGALPPEIISGKMYAGAGHDSIYAAARQWKQLFNEMASAPKLFGEALTKLNAQWSGPSAIRMAEAAALYQEWLYTFVHDIYRTATQAFRLVGAYADARKAVVSPAVIAYNRTRVHELIQSDLFGENTVAIAALEAQYQQFWARDAKAMDTYAANVLDTLSTMTPWPKPPEITETGFAQASATV